jgi:hypothetical protein
MAHIEIPDCGRVAVTFHHAVEDVHAEMTFAVRDTSGAVFTSPATFATKVWNAAVTHLIPQLPPQVVLDGIVWEDVRTLPYGGADFPQTATPGTSGSGAVKIPTDSAIAVKRLTASLGRSYRGRLYWPLWDGSYLVTADTTGATYMNQVVLALTAFQAEVEGDTLPCEMVLISTETLGAPRPAGVATPIVGWAYTDLRVDSQRRRLLGRGR